MAVRRARFGTTLALATLTVAAATARAQAPAPEVATAGLVHEAVTVGARGTAIPIEAGVQNDLAFDKLVLAYRPEGEPDFHGREMKLVAPNTYRAEIPAPATEGARVAYYIEALDKEGAPVAGRASAQSPLVIELTGPRPAGPARARDVDTDDDDPGPRFYVALLVGSGGGWTSGNGDTNADTMLRPSAVELARLGQLAPEVGYWWSSTLLVSVQGRFQAVTGTNDVYANGRVYHTANYAAAGFLKATWLASGGASVRPFFSLAGGFGQIRHVVTFPSLADCGPHQHEECVDTIAGGPVALGPGGGVMADLGAGFIAVLQINTQLTFPTFSFNVDGNLGVGWRF